MQLIEKERQNRERLKRITLRDITEPVMSFAIVFNIQDESFVNAQPYEIISHDAEAMPMFNYHYKIKRGGYVRQYTKDNPVINGKTMEALSLTVFTKEDKFFGICHGSAQQARQLGFRIKKEIHIDDKPEDDTQ